MARRCCNHWLVFALAATVWRSVDANIARQLPTNKEGRHKSIYEFHELFLPEPILGDARITDSDLALAARKKKKNKSSNKSPKYGSKRPPPPTTIALPTLSPSPTVSGSMDAPDNLNTLSPTISGQPTKYYEYKNSKKGDAASPYPPPSKSKKERRPGHAVMPPSYKEKRKDDSHAKGYTQKKQSKGTKKDKLKKYSEEKYSKTKDKYSEKTKSKPSKHSKHSHKTKNHTYSPAPTFIGMPTPTSSGTPEPTDFAPPVTAMPTTGNSVTVRMTPFALNYEFEQPGIPMTNEIEVLVDLTQSYLQSFFETRFLGLTALDLENTGTRFSLQEPYEMNFTASVDIDNPTVPTSEELDIVLTESLSEENLQIYTDLVQRLPEPNFFRGTTDVTFEIFIAGPTNDDATSRKRNNLGLASGIGAAALIAVLAIGKQLQNSSSSKDNDDDGKEPQPVVSVTSETYRGESTVHQERRLHFSDEIQSLASRSEWALSTRAVSEVGSDEESDGPSTSQCLFRKEMEQREDLLLRQPYDSIPEGSMDSDDMTEDEEVPVRVVDLIKLFSPMRG